MRLVLHRRHPVKSSDLTRDVAPDVAIVHDLDQVRVFRGRPPGRDRRDYDEVPDALHLDHLMRPAGVDRRPSDRRVLILRALAAIHTMEEELRYYRDHPALRSPFAYSLYTGNTSAHDYEALRTQIRERVAALERRVERVRAIANLSETD